MAPNRKRGSSKASSAAAAAAAKRNWKIGDLVLAKVKGFPAWPATVSEPEKWGYSTDWKKVLVYFFGTKQIAFCSPADVEAFTEEKKKSLLSKRHGKGADFVRAVQEIVDCYEKTKEQEQDDEVNSGDEGTISNFGNLEDSMDKMADKIEMQSPVDLPDSRLNSLCVSADKNETQSLVDVQTEADNGGLRDMDTVSEEQVENALSLDHLRETMLAASDSIRKRLIDVPLQSCVIQKRTAVRRSRSTVKLEPCTRRSHLVPVNDCSTSTGDVVPNGTRNEFAKRSRRIRKSPGTSVWHHMESPGYSATLASNISSEENGSEKGATNFDRVSFSGGNTLESNCKIDHPGIVVEVLGRGVHLSDGFHLPTETFVFKKKRRPNRKRVTLGSSELTASPYRSPGLDNRLGKTIPHSPNSCIKLPDRFSGANGDEHLPLVKRARVRMGKPSSEEKKHDDLVDAEEASKEVSVNNSEPPPEEKKHNDLVDAEEAFKKISMNNSEPPLPSSSCGNDFHDANGSVTTNGYIHTEKEPIWNASKYQLRGSVDGEAALPPSKRLHRALEAMSANAAEEGQTFVDAEETTKATSSNDCSASSDKSSSHISVDNEEGSDKSSSHISVDNEEGSASEVQNVNFFGDNDANVTGEVELMPGLTPLPSEVLAKASLEPKSCDHLVECSNASESDDSTEMRTSSKNSTEVQHVDSSLKSHSGETNESIKSSHPSSSFEQKQGAKLEPMDLLSPLLKKEKLEIVCSSHGSSNHTVKLERDYLQEDKSAEEQRTSQPNQRQDSSEDNKAVICLSAGDGAHMSVNADRSKNMQSLMLPLDKNGPSTCEVVKEDKYKPAEKDTDANSMKALIAAAQAKRQLSLSTSFSDIALDDKIVCDSVSSPPSVRTVGSYEHVSPPSSMICLSVADDTNHLLHNGSLDVLPNCKKATCVLEKEEMRNLASSLSHRQKSSFKGTNTEANAVRKSFESMLGTLSRTKECIGRATRLAIDCAKYGIASEVLEILARSLETESSLHKRIDLFFLVDSITQCSRGQKGNIGDIYPSAVQAMLPRLLSAAAPPGSAGRENRKQCLKVLRLWLERKTLPESIIRRHVREIESVDSSFTSVHTRRPLRMERALNDPIREIEGMHVDEYGSNASFQLPGFCMPRMLEDEEGSDEDRSFEAVTPEQDLGIPVEREATPTSTFERHCHILEDVDGELEMEDVAPTYEAEKSYADDVSAISNVDTSHHLFDQHFPLPFAPPLPEDCPPPPPPLPASPPPMAPPPPMLPQSVTCHPFTDGADLKFQTSTHNMQNPTQQQMSHQPETPSLCSVISDAAQYYAPGCRDLGKQSLRPESFSSSSSCCSSLAPHPSIHTGSNVQQTDGGSLHNKSYHLQPPPPTLSNQFSYVHADQRRQSWREASSSSYNKRFRYGHDTHREDIYENRERLGLTRHETGERCRIAAPVHSVPVHLDDPEAAYAHYGQPQESTRSLNRGWSFPPRTLNYHNPTPYRPAEAPNFWRPR